jgi:hypothetical protein
MSFDEFHGDCEHGLGFCAIYPDGFSDPEEDQ